MAVKPLIKHLEELRKRLIFVVLFLFVFFIIGVLFSDFIIKKIISDLVFENIEIVALTPTEFILTQIKVGFLAAVVFCFPLIIYELIIFIKPGLNKKERNAIKLILPSFLVLFLMGIVFSYFIFVRVALYFLANLSKGVAVNLWGINKFLSFVFLTCLGFGLIFQMPLFLLILNRLGVININYLRKQRRYVYVVLFVLAALMTPPDIITMIMIAVPLILLYEASLIVLRIF